MIRLVYLLRRREDMSLEAFQRYWRERHGPLVASVASDLGVLRYVQSHALDDPLDDALAQARGGMEPRYDGVAELWFASEAALGEAMATEAGERAGAALLEDEARFIDLPNSPLWLTHEYPQVNPTPEDLVATPRSPLVKLHFPLRLRADVGFEAGQRYWRTTHGPVIRSQAQAAGILRYMQVHRFETDLERALREPRGTEVAPYDGHAEVWIDRGRGRTGPEAEAANARAVEDEGRFIDFARSCMWIGKEYVFVDRMGWD